MPWEIKFSSAYRKAHIARELFLCLFSAILLILSFPNFNLWLLAWFGFVPLFFALENKSKGKAFLLAYFSGVIFWSGTIYWLIHVTLPGTILLILYLALYFGIFGLIITNYQLPITNYQLLFYASIWVLLEYIRSHLFTGFGWALLGYSQYLDLAAIQISDITGAYGVSFLVMMVNVAVYSQIAYRKAHIANRYILPILCLSVVLSYGYYRILRTPYSALRTPLKISVIQGNIPQELKWAPQMKGYIVDKYLRLSQEAGRGKPDLIIWPEAALPVVLEEEPQFFEEVKKLTQKNQIPILLGALTTRDNAYYNSAVLLSGLGEVSKRYDKLHLVPFGEYIPLKKALPFLETVVPIGDIAPGKEYTIFKIQNPKSSRRNVGIPMAMANGTSGKIQNKFSVLICFEDLFPELARQFAKKGAEFLVNITNDAWYKKTSAAAQHFQASVFRAVENRLVLVRSANTGISGFIDQNGKIISLVSDKMNQEIFVDGFKTQDINIKAQGTTFYTRYGDVFIIFCLLFILYGIISRLKIKDSR